MKTTKLIQLMAALCCLLGPALLAAPPFDSGSDGSYGPMNITSTTNLDLPPDGIFNCTTIDIARGVTLTFKHNALNTPVYLLATGDVNINGTIDVSGKAGLNGLGGEGGPGGFDGGAPANGPTEVPGDGLGPGGGKGSPGAAGSGAYSSGGAALNDGQSYGNSLIVPLIGGSGGGGSSGGSSKGGGGGGGAILIASTTRVSSDGFAIQANGGQGPTVGSGGAVRIVAPEVAGNFVINTYGYAPNSPGHQYPGLFGRIRVDAIRRSDLHIDFNHGPFSNEPNLGSWSIGKYMHVFPPQNSRLDIIEAAGQAIAVGTLNPVPVQLPVGSPTNQTIKIQAQNFPGILSITVAVTPDNGPSTRYEEHIDMSTGNPAQKTVNVIIPAGVTSRIHAWTR